MGEHDAHHPPGRREIMEKKTGSRYESRAQQEQPPQALFGTRRSQPLGGDLFDSASHFQVETSKSNNRNREQDEVDNDTATLKRPQSIRQTSRGDLPPESPRTGGIKKGEFPSPSPRPPRSVRSDNGSPGGNSLHGTPGRSPGGHASPVAPAQDHTDLKMRPLPVRLTRQNLRLTASAPDSTHRYESTVSEPSRLVVSAPCGVAGVMDTSEQLERCSSHEQEEEYGSSGGNTSSGTSNGTPGHNPARDLPSVSVAQERTNLKMRPSPVRLTRQNLRLTASAPDSTHRYESTVSVPPRLVVSAPYGVAGVTNTSEQLEHCSSHEQEEESPPSVVRPGVSEHHAQLRLYMPDAWSCPPNNDAEIFLHREVRLAKVKDNAAMVVANKPVPTKYLEQLRRTASSQNSGVSSSSRVSSQSSIVYYFEVTLTLGAAVWIGLVPSTDKNRETSSSRRHPYDVSVGRVPGEAPGSFGLSSGGILLMSGGRASSEGFGQFQKGDTLGCGVEIPAGPPKILFTKNGELLEFPARLQQLKMEQGVEYFPAVALAEGNIAVVGNLGLGSVHLKWDGDGRRWLARPEDSIVVPGTAKAATPLALEQHETCEPGWGKNAHSSKPPCRPGQDEQIVQVGTNQSLPGAHPAVGPPQTKPAPITQNRSNYLTFEVMEDATARAHKLETLCSRWDDDISEVEELLHSCQKIHESLCETVESLLSESSADPQAVHEALDLNGTVLQAIETAEQYIQSRRKTPPDAKSTPDAIPEPPAPTPSAKAEEYTRNKDIFGLICMLRSSSVESRLDAALALMRFSIGEGSPEEESAKLRAEIISTGGMPSLLTLFKSKSTPPPLKTVAAMTVAHLSPSFISHNEISSLINGCTGLKIIECLRFLSDSPAVPSRGIELSANNMLNASIIGATDFWLNALTPTLNNPLNKKALVPHGRTNDRCRYALLSSSRRHRLKLGSGGGFAEERHDTLEVQELVETTVSLIVHLARLDTCENAQTKARDFVSRYTAVEAVCGVAAARPIAVREGLLKILLVWLESKDKERIHSAATALRCLTSTKDKYMAGWIHSQIVSEERALVEIVRLLGDPNVRHDIRLALTETVSHLCVASHTRSALVHANCTGYLTDLLWEHSKPGSQQIVLAAATALLQLAAGAIDRAGVYRNGYVEPNAADPSEERERVIEDIVCRGAFGPFIDMAGSETSGKLRLTSVEALRVLSEDVNPIRRTRLILCKEGVTRALGVVLKRDVELLCQLMKSNGSGRKDGDTSTAEVIEKHETFHELYHALCALSNILEPAHDNGSTPLFDLATSDSLGTRDALLTGCIQTAESGGLHSLLWIACMACKPEKWDDTESIGKADVLIESCRSLASLSSLLISDEAASEGLAIWACEVLEALQGVLKLSAAADDNRHASAIFELQFNALRGIGSLAEFAPLKLMIVDESLPFLLQARDARGDHTYVSNAASQVCLALGFTEDEVAVQVAGNDPTLLGDWFCLQRSLILQAMAREEIRNTIIDMWKGPIRNLNNSRGAGPKKFIQESSSSSSTLSGHTSTGERSSSEDMPLRDLFESLEKEDGSLALRDRILRQYQDIFERGTPRQEGFCGASIPLARNSRDENTKGLLSRHVYPLNQVATEKEWVLHHGRAIGRQMEGNSWCQASSNPVCDRIQKLLDCCFPSRLLQKQILPVTDLRPDSPFNFRTLLMPQRRYFSFRREGQIVSGLCEKHSASIEVSEDVHWSIGFTNSTFAGEFTETLVQALYRCPIVEGISFSRNLDWDTRTKENEQEDGTDLLADLFSSLPPWISSLTFDRILTERFMKVLIRALERIEALSVGEGQDLDSAKDSQESLGQRQGTLRFLALRNSPKVGNQAFKYFFSLLGSLHPGPNKPPFKSALSQLRALDVSGNNLADDACAILLDMAHKPKSGCVLEHLDLSRNSIGKGSRVQKVLWSYVKTHRYCQRRGIQPEKKSWCSPLRTLNLASNHLCEGELALDLILYLKHNTLNLKSLDLSDNGLQDSTYGQFAGAFCSSLSRNTTILELDLSSNKFSSAFLDETLDRLNQSESRAGVPFLRFDSNVPELSDEQRSSLNKFVIRSRQVALERYVDAMEETAGADDDTEGVTAGTIEDSLPPIDERKELRRSAELISIGHEVEDSSFVSKSTSSLGTSASLKRYRQLQRRPSHQNMITVLFSAPLVYRTEEEGLQPFQKLDFVMERELLWQCLKEACRDIKLTFDNATSDRLVTMMTNRCDCLHYSGHGHEHYLPLENRNGDGGTYWLHVRELEELISKGEHVGGAPFKFVFVSACYSFLAGETFAKAGVKHVVCCQQNSELKDASALAFTRQFYLALAVGRTVKDAFDQGCKAVRLTPNKDPEEEMKKFVLLPSDGNHNVPIFDARPLSEWPNPESSSGFGSKPKRGRELTRSRSSYLGGTKSSELSVRNMIQEDPSPTPPHFFLGREVEMHLVLTTILSKRLVSIVAPAGFGSSSLACALCHYINERRSTISAIDSILYISAKRSSRSEREVSLIKPLIKRLHETRSLKEPEAGEDVETVFKSIFKCLPQKALIVFDGTELLEGSDEAQDFPLFLSGLFQNTPQVKVLLTGRKSLGIPSFGGVVDHRHELGPLSFANTVKLFLQLCPHAHTPRERAMMYETLVTNAHTGSFHPGDSDVEERTLQVFKAFGNGVPSEIEKAACAMEKEELMKLCTISERP